MIQNLFNIKWRFIIIIGIYLYFKSMLCALIPLMQDLPTTQASNPRTVVLVLLVLYMDC